jgi:hypothetical protein
VCVEACLDPNAQNKVVEIIASADAEEKTFADLFASIA